MIPHNIKNKLYLLFLPLLLLLLLQCGLNTYPYLYPPDTVVRLTGSDVEFIIANRGDNNPDVFLGYELYYKFYNFTDATVAMANDDRAIFSIDQPTPNDVTRLGFRRVNTVPTDDRTTRIPMIPVNYSDRKNNFNITLNFFGVASGENAVPRIIPEVSYLSYPIVELYRQVLDPDDDIKNKYKSFGDLINELSGGSRDSDLPSTWVTLSLYIFAYGKYDKVYNIYSKPLWLGYINYQQR